MREYEGTGIAAPQVYTPLRIFLRSPSEVRKRKEKEVPLTAFFNASYEGVGDRVEETRKGVSPSPFSGARSCRGSRRSGSPRSTVPANGPLRGLGYHARVLQHEIDHLDGLVYLDRMRDMKSSRIPSASVRVNRAFLHFSARNGSARLVKNFTFSRPFVESRGLDVGKKEALPPIRRRGAPADPRISSRPPGKMVAGTLQLALASALRHGLLRYRVHVRRLLAL